MTHINTEEIIRQIETDGYCQVPQVFSPEQVGRALELVFEWQRRSEDSLSDNVPFLNRNQPMIYNLQSKDYFFLQLLFAQDFLQKVLMHFLNDMWFKQIPQTEPNYILRSYLARSSKAALPMHIDSFVPYTGCHVFAMQASMILEDQNEINGCTVIVPGSHQAGKYATQAAFEEAIPITSKAGDLVIWDSRIWHGTTANNSDRTRWALIATFTRWWIKQAFEIHLNVPQEIYERLTDNQKAILGFCSIPYRDEAHGIDMKRGYDSLPKNVSEYQA
jgi:hypothetical protein